MRNCKQGMNGWGNYCDRKRTSDGRKGLLAKVVDHLLQQQSIPRPDGRSFSREFLFHHVGCTPAGQVIALIRE